MKKRSLIFVFLVMITTVFLIDSCKKDSNPAALNLGTLTVGNIDLNGAIAPTGVPINPTITATFSTDVDATTAIPSNITLTEDYDTVSITLSLSVSGKTLTVTPANKLAAGALYKLAITAGLKATNGQPLTAISRSFTTAGSFIPSGQFAYWNFDGNANDQVSTYNPTANGVIDITYVPGRNSASGQAASFNGTTSLIEIPNGDVLENATDFSISFWLKEDSTGRPHQFVMGLAAWQGFQFEINNNDNNKLGWCKLAAQYSLAGGTSASQDLYFDGAATNSTKDNGGWQGWTFAKDLTSNSGTGVNGLIVGHWAHIVCTYNSVTKIGTMYINGEEMKAQDFNLYGDTHPLYNATGLKFAGNADNNAFVLGFIQDKVDPTITDSWADYTIPGNAHFQGLLDDVSIFHKVLSPKIITLMYNSGSHL